MSQDSFEARRALRAAQREDSDDGEEGSEGGVDQEQRQDGALLRPGEEAVHEDGLQPDDAPTAGTKRTRPKLTYEMLTVSFPVLDIEVFQDLRLLSFISRVCRPQQVSQPYLALFAKHFTDNEAAEAIQQRILGILLDLYEQWQKQVFPHTDFDTFTKKVAGLYGKPGGKQTTGATLKGDVRELRESVIQVALDNMVESLDEHDAPVQDELDEGTAPASDTNLANVDIPDLFDPDELMPLHPTAVEEGDEFDDMLC